MWQSPELNLPDEQDHNYAVSKKWGRKGHFPFKSYHTKWNNPLQFNLIQKELSWHKASIDAEWLRLWQEHTVGQSSEFIQTCSTQNKISQVWHRYPGNNQADAGVVVLHFCVFLGKGWVKGSECGRELKHLKKRWEQDSPPSISAQTTRHRDLSPLLLQTPHMSIFHIFALICRKTADFPTSSQSTHSRWVTICLVNSSCPGQAFSKKTKFGVTGITGAPSYNNCLHFRFTWQQDTLLLSSCQTTGTEHFAGTKATLNTQLRWGSHVV